MPVHIQEITSNVTVADGRAASSGPTPPVADAIVPASEDLPNLETMISEATHGLATDKTFVSQAASSSGEQGGGAATLTVDPSALYERVLRMLLDDLRIAREREWTR